MFVLDSARGRCCNPFAADRAISENHAARRYRHVRLHRRDRSHRGVVGHYASRGGDQRRRRLTLHFVNEFERRDEHDPLHVRIGQEPRHRRVRRPECGGHRERAPSDRGHPRRRHRDEKCGNLRHGLRIFVEQSKIQHALSEQLRRSQYRRRAQAHSGRQQRHRVRRTQVRDASLDRSQAPRRLQPFE